MTVIKNIDGLDRDGIIIGEYVAINTEIHTIDNRIKHYSNTDDMYLNVNKRKDIIVSKLKNGRKANRIHEEEWCKLSLNDNMIIRALVASNGRHTNILVNDSEQYVRDHVLVGSHLSEESN